MVLCSFLSLVLVVSLVPSASWAEPAETSEHAAADEGVEAAEASEAAETDETAIAAEASSDTTIEVAEAAEKDDAANSFRFHNGEPIEPSEEATGEMSLSADNLSAITTMAVPPRAVMARGVDVSVHNGTIDWAKAKRSGKVDFAIIRCGYGQDEKGQDDKQWLRNAKECKRLGIPFGVYLYSYAGNAKRATGEAEHALRCLRDAGIRPSDLAYPVYFDMEDRALGKNKTVLANMAKNFCTTITKAGYKTGVYANTNWWNNYLTSSVFDNYERWVAQYNTRYTYEGTYRIWQYTSSGSVAGISGRVDMNYDYGTTPSIPDAYAAPKQPYERTIADGEYYFTTALNNASVMDIKGGSTANGANLQLYAVNKSQAQRFKVVRDSKTGYYTITNVKSNRSLGMRAVRSGVYQTNVAQYKTNNNDHSQKWIISKNSDGTYTFEAAMSPSYALDVSGAKTANGTNLHLYASNGTKAQKFKATGTNISVRPGETLSEGLYVIASKLDASNNKVLDVSGASTANGAAIQLYTANKTQAQMFRVQKASNGFYYLINAKSGKALEVQGGGLVNEAKVQQWSVSSSDNKLWVATKNKDGSYSFQSKTSGLMLDVAGAKTANGTKLQTYQGNGSDAQKFVLIDKTDAMKTVNPGTYTICSAAKNAYVLDVAGASMSNSANVQLYQANNTPAQSYKVSYDRKTGYYAIQNVKSGKYLDVKGGKAGNSANVQQYQGNGSLAQRWLISLNSDKKSYTITSAVNESYVLDIKAGKLVNKANVQLYRSNGTSAQSFTFANAVHERSVANGTYVIASSLDTNFVLDVKGGSKADRANVQLYRSNSSKAQQFSITYDASTGYYTVKNVQSGKMLDVSGASMKNKANIWQYANNGSWAQKWIVAKNADGSYTFKAALNPSFVATANGAVAANGLNIELHKQSAGGQGVSSKAQSFVLKKL